MTNNEKLNELVNYYLSQGDLSHQRYGEKIEDDCNNDVFSAVGRLFQVSFLFALDSWIIAQRLKSLHEAELVDGGSGKKSTRVSLNDLYKDLQAERKYI